jgi:quercetin dioxygenase-like cupin family protein
VIPREVGSDTVTTNSFVDEMRALGHRTSEWSNGSGDTYAAHAHPYKKILCCLEGSIVFHVAEGDVTLSAGDRLVLEPGTEHSATVGPSGVRCAEAHVT